MDKGWRAKYRSISVLAEPLEPRRLLSGGLIAGVVYEDVNLDGVQDQGDTVAPNVHVFIDTNGNGTQDAGEVATTTGADGRYLLSGLQVGAVSLDIVVPAGFAVRSGSSKQSLIVNGTTDTLASPLGLYHPASISGYVFNDANGNGTQDAGEEKLSGSTLAMSAPSQVVQIQSDGSFLAAPLLPGTYHFSCGFNQPGWHFTTAQSLSVSVSAGQAFTGLRFGVKQNDSTTGSIAVFTYNDANGNGARDPGDAPFSTATIYLDENHDGVFDNGEPSQESQGTSAAAGWVVFSGLKPGAYAVRVVPSMTYHVTSPMPVIVNVTANHEATAMTGVAAGPTLGSLTVSTFYDLNGDGGQESGDTALAGQQAFLDLNDDGVQDPGEPGGITGANGQFTINNVTPGINHVRLIVPSGWSAKPNGGQDVFVNPGGNAVAEFGMSQTEVISGKVFNDANRNGVFDSGEAGLSGWQVYWDLQNDGFPLGNTTVTTDANGHFAFPAFRPGTYVIREIVKSGWKQSPAGQSFSITLTSGKTPGPVSFGDFKVAGTISGTVFQDMNSNNTLDSADVGLSGWTVYLDANNDKIFDTGDISTITTSSGSYLFSGLSAGNFSLRVVTQSGWTPFYTGGISGSLASGGSFSGLNFPFTRTPLNSASLSGFVYNDLNTNLLRDSGESGIAGTRLFLDTNKNGLLDSGETSVLTDANGHYQFSGLLAGSYLIVEQPAAGWIIDGTSNNIPRTLTTGQSYSAANFPNVPATRRATISGTVYKDLNQDRIRESTEPPLSGWTFYIDANNNGRLDAGETSVLTGADGIYRFANLLPGVYTVLPATPAGWRFTTSTGFTQTLSGRDISTHDFGAINTALLTGVIYQDVNKDGKQNAGDINLTGWTAYIDANNNGKFDAGELAALTATNGYTFNTLAAGTYVVRIVTLSGFTLELPTAKSYTVTVTAGQIVSARNFGVIGG